MQSSMRNRLRNLVLGGIGAVALSTSVLVGAGAASAADGTINCGTIKFLTTFSYTPAGVGQPNSHRHQNMSGPGDVTFTKWEGGNYTTYAGYHHDRYTLAGTNKGAWCEV